MGDRRTSTHHEIDTFTDDYFSWDFVNDISHSDSSDNFSGTWFMISFFGIFSIIVAGVIYLWYRLLKVEHNEEDNNIEIGRGFEDIIRGVRLEADLVEANKLP